MDLLSIRQGEGSKDPEFILQDGQGHITGQTWILCHSSTGFGPDKACGGYLVLPILSPKASQGSLKTGSTQPRTTEHVVRALE